VHRGATVNQPLVAATADARETEPQIQGAGGAMTTSLRPPTAAKTAAAAPLHVGRFGGADDATLHATTADAATAAPPRAERGGDRSSVLHPVAAATAAAAVSPRSRRSVPAGS